MRTLEKIKIEDVLFLDIETSTQVKELELDTPLYDAWQYKKKKDITVDSELISAYANEAALYPEFGRVVCITVGKLVKEEFITQTFNNLDEGQLITDFYNCLDRHSGYICGHSIKQFDIPYIIQRGYSYGLKPHSLLDTSGLKPWELEHILDTKDLWRGTSISYASLLSVCTTLGVKSPKEDLQGSDVPKFFWENPEDNIDRITEYCERDVFATYKVLDTLINLKPHEKSNNAPNINRFSVRGVVQKRDIIDKGLLVNLMEGGRYTKKIKDQLIKTLSSMSDEEREKAYVILGAVVSTAKGKTTKFTKKHLKELKDEFSQQTTFETERN